MAPLSSLPEYGLNTDDVRYLNIESVVRGRGPERLKYLDLEGKLILQMVPKYRSNGDFSGHWTLSGKSIPFISAAFNHLDRLNDARFPFRVSDQLGY